MKNISVFLVSLLTTAIIGERILERCEFAYAMQDIGIEPSDNWLNHMSKWTCIAQESTGFNTSFFGNTSGIVTYGILKISNDWCEDETGNPGNGCSVQCAELQNDDMVATAVCASHIYKVYGDSFLPWQPAWGDTCQHDTTHVVGNCTRDVVTEILGDQPLEIYEGEDATIVCRARGYPPPDVWWEWDAMEDDDHITIQNGTRDDIYYFTNITLTQVTSKDTHTFSCFSRNDHSEHTTDVEVVVKQNTASSQTIGSSSVTTETATDSTTEPIKTDTTTDATVGPTSETDTTDQPTTTTVDKETSDTRPTTVTATSPSTEQSSAATTIVTMTEESTVTTSTTSASMSSSPASDHTTSATTPFTTLSSGTSPRPRLTACELARRLTNIFSDTFDWNEDLEKWLCLSDVTTKFDSNYYQETGGMAYYGIFKIRNFWCHDPFNSENECNVDCPELRDAGLVSSVNCSQYIYHKSNSFEEWPEFEEDCLYPPEYLDECSRKPYFTTDAEDETNKVFIEFELNQNVSCSAKGYPRPAISWDVATMAYINSSNARIQIGHEESKDEEDNLVVTHSIHFTEVWMSDYRQYICEASNIAGLADLIYSVKVIGEGDDGFWKEVAIGVGSLLGLLSLLAIPLGIAVYRRRKKREIELEDLYIRFKYGQQHDGQLKPAQSNNPIAGLYDHIARLPFPKKLEILPNRLRILESVVLGSGAFGVVFQGTLDGRVTVAIKTVRKDAEPAVLDALLSEVKIMSYVGYHPNIVQLLGVEMIDLRRGIFHAAVEFCPMGSLESLLRERRRGLSTAHHYSKLGQRSSGSSFLKGYLYGGTLQAVPFSRLQLLKFSHQVSMAMEYLEAKKVIHGDLAARNVLVDAHWTAKISDFGLSTRIYDTYKSYVMANKGTLLPWRWLAIEALVDLRFSTASDVWAFGVFMWEVFSLAELPYSAGISWGPSFVESLQQGFRLPQPSYANSEIYNLMRRCWDAAPNSRIQFRELSVALLQFLGYEELRKSN